MTTICLNGEVVGEVRRPEKFIAELRKARKDGKIPPQLNFIYKKERDEVIINSDSGRVRRPLIVVKNGKPLLTSKHLVALSAGQIKWSDLVKEGIIEYLDSDEEEGAFVALRKSELTKEHTHLELDPATILGLSSSLIPYANHNRGDRVNFGAKMTGQSLGIYARNFPIRTDTKANMLAYPQRPLVTTIAYNKLKLHEHCAGENVVVALISHGYSMQDAIVVNKRTVERGFGRSFFFRTYQTEEMRYLGGEEDRIKIPEKDVRGYRSEKAYANLGKDGIISPETVVRSGDVLIGKMSPLRFLGRTELMREVQKKRETSITLRHGEVGVVDKVLIMESVNGNKLVKVCVRDQRVPEIGDKFASRHGQKGVIGLIVPEEDMPFTQSGITPDIIVNPHSIPSRLTVGQLLEMLAGKVGSLDGRHIDGTPFSGEPEEKLRDTLLKLGFRSDGKERLYNGLTGEEFEVEIFIGVIYYQKLEHMVANKIHARSRGPVTLLTKQPTEGRAKEGGLRLGEMEKDCLIAHGTSLLLHERFSSDEVAVAVCSKCGMLGYHDWVKGRDVCPVCTKSEIKHVRMSYAFKQMLDELKTLVIYPRICPSGDPPKIGSIKFEILSPTLIKRMGVVDVIKPELYDRDGYPVDGGIMDPKLGVVDPGMRCRTCGGRVGTCYGHFGYLKLAKPVIHVKYAELIYQLLRATCESCGRALASDRDLKEMRNPLQTLYRSKKKTCPHCDTKQRDIKFDKPHAFRAGREKLSASEIREWFEKIPEHDQKAFGLAGGHPAWLIITILPIPPVTMRPSITLETGERSEDDLTHKLVDVIRINQRLRDNIDIGAPDFIIEDLAELLQYHISTLFDNELVGIPQARHRSGRPLRTLTQRLKGKEGRFRGNLSGKRVNYSSRTVISPDPNISINEVGIPKCVARELTIPVTVNKMNIDWLRKLVKAGPDAQEGANYIITPDGRKRKISPENRLELAKEISDGYIVERHLLDGDIVIFNRQPSLHRMSIMAHRARIMPGRTFRINLAACAPYNADFDGDEMNLHVPQTDEARAEAEELMLVEKHINSPRFGGPIIGCIQDHISGNYMLTKMESISPELASQILMSVGIEEPVPRDLSGREIFSYLLPKNLTCHFRNNLCKKCEKCKKEACPDGAYVSIVDGKLRVGIIDERAIGEEKGILIGKIERDFGHTEARKFIDKVSSLGIKVLEVTGFTIGVSDQDIPPAAKGLIKKIVAKVCADSNKLIRQCKSGTLPELPGQTIEESLETYIMKKVSKGLADVSDVIERYLPENCAVIMAISGARGSMVNLTQLAGCVGQQTIGGERIHRGYKDRTITYFRPGELAPAAHGFVALSFKEGLVPPEFFFNAMNGREGLMDKSLRTRHSGYMERRLVTALQDLKVEYDGTVRDSNNTIIQFIPAEDGVDPSRSDWGKIDIAPLVKRGPKEYDLASLRGILPPIIIEEIEHRVGKNIDKSALDEIINKYREALYEPGEAVGIVTAQSISEPATQMTMRTYHIAGAAGVQVTLGLPRLMEILDARRTPTTPAMTIYLEPKYNTRDGAKEIAKKIRETKLRDVVLEDTIDLATFAIEIKIDKGSVVELNLKLDEIEKKARNVLRNFDVSLAGSVIRAVPKKEMSIFELQKAKAKVLDTTILGISGIEQVVVRKTKGEWVIYTSGSNLKKILKIDGVDGTRVLTNDIHEIEAVLGIEAARNSIIKEISSTLEQQGLVVGIRHIMLVADMMTAGGTISPIGRYGLSGEKASVLARANFETTVRNITSAAINGEVDSLGSIIENVLINQVVPVGTGMFDLVLKK